MPSFEGRVEREGWGGEGEEMERDRETIILLRGKLGRLKVISKLNCGYNGGIVKIQRFD